MLREDDLRVEIVDQVARKKPFDGRLRADGHENRSLHIAMSGVKNPRAGAGSRANGLNLESEHRFYCRC